MSMGYAEKDEIGKSPTSTLTNKKIKYYYDKWL